MKDILNKKIDLFIAYHGDKNSGSLKYAEKIYEEIKNSNLNIEVYLHSITNPNGQFSTTPIIVQHSKLFLLVVTELIPRSEDNLILTQDDKGFKKRLFEEIEAFSESDSYRKSSTFKPCR